MTVKITVKIWDIPIRVFHWSLVGLLGGLWWSADAGEMELHQIFAYCLLVLLVVRIIWGFVGSDTARFSDFVRSPKAAINYLRGSLTPNTLGHNPAGGYMVVMMLLVLLVQLVTGLFATDDIMTEGPLYYLASSEQSRWLNWLHKTNFTLLQVLVVCHILAVVVHQLKGERLIQAMFSGNKPQNEKLKTPEMKPSWWAAGLFLGLSVIIGYYLIWPIYQYL
ncbi:cytochrome b/b6 domain-containing protein [Shewanella intestini]|uniref:Cytochrome B n=1 Tax=Shewanella intestini TaxID=2017544 RepID=A0ABS5HY17_9GAMM|nr:MULTISPECIES: cytochrome b/b6 domain-containing protein [Shewanella]MBR9726668.1 cytochrome B [Shewanella intestini]MRG34766.1 cytochrome B [Shewanella sp. XMDDZSB0408]